MANLTVQQDPFMTFLIEKHEEKVAKMTKNEISVVDITVTNSVVTIPPKSEQDRNTFEWTVGVSEPHGLIERVSFHLHPTFTPSTISLVDGPFEITRQGWGEFTIRIDVWIREEKHEFEHRLLLSQNTTYTVQLNLADGILIKRIRDLIPNLSPFEFHGRLCDGQDWHDPMVVVECAELARPGYHSMLAHEYEDDPRTLRAKVRLLANLIRHSQNLPNGLMTYTGAGISTSSGIEDYASKAKDSYMYKHRAKARNGFEAEPTLGHRVLTAMYHAGYLKHWVQQNHDGLPQKAGFPQHEINEIHGAWFDVSNPVVPMSGTLRDDLCDWMKEWETKCDLVLAMGTSLCGMNADRCVNTPQQKYLSGQGLGGVIVGLQRTPYDADSSIRIFAKIDEVVALLAEELELEIPEFQGYFPKVPEEYVYGEDQFKIPYDRNGNLSEDPSEWIIWDLREGQKMKVVSGPGAGFNGKMRKKCLAVHYGFCCANIREGDKNHGKGFVNYVIGAWWVETAVKGLWHQIPIVNKNPTLQSEVEQLSNVD